LTPLSDLPGLALFDELVEVDKERVGVVRAGGGFRVVLHREDRQLLVAQALDGVIVEIDFRDDGVAGLEALGIRREAVVLRGDGDATGLEVLDRLVAAAVTELELERLSAEGVREHLVSQTDAE